MYFLSVPLFMSSATYSYFMNKIEISSKGVQAVMTPPYNGFLVQVCVFSNEQTIKFVKELVTTCYSSIYLALV